MALITGGPRDSGTPFTDVPPCGLGVTYLAQEDDTGRLGDDVLVVAIERNGTGESILSRSDF